MCQEDYWLDHYGWPNHDSPHERWKRSQSGSTDSLGPTGEPLPLAARGATLVRRHQGLSTISVGFLILHEEVPATFLALKQDDSDVYMVTLSFALTSIGYANFIQTLEGISGIDGENVTVVVKFEPTTQNSVRPTIAPSTS